MAVIYHFNSCWNCTYISSNSYHVNYTVLLWNDILTEISSSHISHNSYLQISIVLTNNGPDVLLITELPFSKGINIKLGFRSLVTKLHIINACCHISLVQFFYEFICKTKIINQTSISYCTVNYLDIWSERYQFSLLFHHNALLLSLF